MHTQIVGITLSGKTVLARHILNANPDIPALVFDPLKSGGWPTHCKCFSNFKAFVKAMDTHNSCVVIIDEARVVFEEDKALAEKWLYQYRHRGYKIYLLSQRAKMIPPNARNNCPVIYSFKQKREDAVILAQEYGEELLDVTKLNKLEFIYSNGFETKKGKLEFDNSGKSNIVNLESQGDGDN
jgi:hypothetical protein